LSHSSMRTGVDASCVLETHLCSGSDVGT
jgi:hypothetical protein